jgi:hypothetical protein
LVVPHAAEAEELHLSIVKTSSSTTTTTSSTTSSSLQVFMCMWPRDDPASTDVA